MEVGGGNHGVLQRHVRMLRRKRSKGRGEGNEARGGGYNVMEM